MQEVFRDCDEQKTRIMASIKNRRDKYPSEDVQDESTMGRLELDSFKLLNDVIEKKIKLAVIHSKTVIAKQNPVGKDEKFNPEHIKLSPQEIKGLQEIAAQESQRIMNYDLSDKK